MLRHGHRYYHANMDEYGYVLFNTIYHAAQLIARERPWDRARVDHIRRRVVGLPHGGKRLRRSSKSLRLCASTTVSTDTPSSVGNSLPTRSDRFGKRVPSTDTQSSI